MNILDSVLSMEACSDVTRAVPPWAAVFSYTKAAALKSAFHWYNDVCTVYCTNLPYNDILRTLAFSKYSSLGERRSIIHLLPCTTPTSQKEAIAKGES